MNTQYHIYRKLSTWLKITTVRPRKNAWQYYTALNHFRPYLLDRRFTLVADHGPLNWMHSRKDPGQRLMRWMFKFTGYEYTFKYKPGKLNCNADALSRNPVEEPTEEDINRALPGIKILVLQEGKLAPKAPGYPKVPGPSGNPNRAPAPTNTSDFCDALHVDRSFILTISSNTNPSHC